MSFSLYDAVIPAYLQILPAVSGLLAKAKAFCADKGVSEADIIGTRLVADMLPFSYQARSVALHSLGAIEGVRNGIFRPDMTPPPETFAALDEKITDALTAIKQIDAAEINGFIGQDMIFQLGERQMKFTAENFLLSFAQPNFYFHATTVYDILRHKSVAIGKRDFLGAMRLKK
jgi:uncharacterized protein